ncbi:MAG: hypothetical protein IT509_13180 [Rhodocyclaceae bacterium]|nr:hypothetical protein [Rhodocyclaceae bacterium]
MIIATPATPAPDSTPVGAPEIARPPKLLDQVRARLRVKHYSIRTEDRYVHWMKRFQAPQAEALFRPPSLAMRRRMPLLHDHRPHAG